MEVNSFHIMQMENQLFDTMAKRVSEGASANAKRHNRYTLHPVDYVIAAIENVRIAPYVTHIVNESGLTLQELRSIAAIALDRDDATVHGRAKEPNSPELPALATRTMLVKLRQSYEDYLTTSASDLRMEGSAHSPTPTPSRWDWAEQLVRHALQATVESNETP